MKKIKFLKSEKLIFENYINFEKLISKMKNRKKMIPHKKDIQNFFMLKMAKEKFGNL